jgi:hypothetical protein
MCRAVLLVLCLLTSPVWAATYYTAPGGNDSHTCAQAQSFATARATLQGGIQCLASGDTLLLGDGTYHEQISDVVDDEHPGTTRPPAGLSWEHPTVIRAQHLHKAILDKPQGGHPYSHTVMLGMPDTQYLSLEGLVIDGRGHATCVWIGPGSHLRLVGNVIKNCGGNGVYASVADDASGGQDLQIIGNEIYNIATEQSGPPGNHGIYFVGNHSRLAANYIHAPCPYYGIHATSEHGGLHDNVIEANRVRGCGQAGIVNQGSNTIVRNNLLESNGIGVQCNGSANQQVLHNTIYGWTKSTANGEDSYGILDLSGGCTIANNLILQQMDVSYVPSYIYWIGTPNVSGNLCDGVQQQQCQGYVEDFRTVLMDAPGGDLRLKEGSPALDRATPLAAVPTDRLRTPRPQGGAADLGAFEGTGSGTLPPIPPDPPDPPTPGGTIVTCRGVLGTPAVGTALALVCAPEEGKR